jgi:hypothetical protein
MARNTIKTEQLFSQREHTEDELALVGASHNAARLADGGRARLVFAGQDADALAEWGFDAAWRKQLAAEITALTEQKGNRELVGSAARPSAASATDATDAIHQWVKRYETAVALAPHAIHDVAPHPVRGWERHSKLVAAVEPLVKFTERTPALKVPTGAKAFAAQGRAALSAYQDHRESHFGASKTISDEVQALHVREGVVALELQRLAKAAHDVLPAKRAAQYGLSELRFGKRPKSNGSKQPSGPAAKPSATA